MNLLKHLRVRESTRTRPAKTKVEFNAAIVDSTLKFNTQREYFVTLIVQSNFWASDTQYEDALRLAERHLLHTIYSGVLASIDEIALAVHNDDTQYALARLSELRNSLINNGKGEV